MHPIVLNRMLSALSKPGTELAVSVAPSAHASLEGGNEAYYRLVHFNPQAQLAWIVNPATNHVCKVAEAELLGWKYLRSDKQVVVDVEAAPPEQLYLVFTMGSTIKRTKEEAQAMATQYANTYRGTPVYVGQAVSRVLVPVEPKPEITEY